MENLILLIDHFFGWLNGVVGSVLLFNVLYFTEKYNLPLTVLWLIVGATYFTFRLRFINFRGFGHAVKILRGVYDTEGGAGEVTHFQALCAALSATVGLGNIAGVAIAIATGGPGATVWMIVAGFLGMSSKYAECTLAVMYRTIRPNGAYMGGAMEYLSKGLSGLGFKKTGQILATVFCVLCIGNSFGGGNAFQSNQSFYAVKENFPIFENHSALYGLLIAAAVAIVILGGLKRIATTAEKLVPVMCALYIGACVFIISSNFTAIPNAFALIFREAFSWNSVYGGFLGSLVIGFRRATFSNEAGIGSAPIAHAVAKTDIPVQEGFVSLLEPFIDTVVICTMTSLVMVITGAYNDPTFIDLVSSNQGAALTSRAFQGEVWWFSYILCASVVLFAYSTMISWSYYGERCWTYLFGEKYVMIYKVLFIIFSFLGAISKPSHILEFSDLMVLGMAFINIIGLYLLFPQVSRATKAYEKVYLR
jgi:AGCS family alanine or glycine:cation symporter